MEIACHQAWVNCADVRRGVSVFAASSLIPRQCREIVIGGIVTYLPKLSLAERRKYL